MSEWGVFDVLFVFACGGLLMLVLLWAASKLAGLGDLFDHLPDWMKAAASKWWTWVIGGGVAAFLGWLSYRQDKPFSVEVVWWILGIGVGLTVLVILLAFVMKKLGKP